MWQLDRPQREPFADPIARHSVALYAILHSAPCRDRSKKRFTICTSFGLIGQVSHPERHPRAMQLNDGQTIDVTGTVGNRQVIKFGEGQTFAKAMLLPGGSDFPLKVVWWDSGRAPPDGARVRIKSRVKEFNGAPEIHAQETAVERTGATGSLLPSIAAFYLACVEAEAAITLCLRPGGKGHIVPGSEPLHQTLRFPEQSPHHHWFEARRTSVGETLLSGWPLVVGTDPDTGKGGFVASPLLISEAELGTSDGVWQFQNLGAGADLNPLALDLLGIKREARDELAAAVASSVEVEDSMTSAARFHAILQALQEEGVDGLDDLDPTALDPPPDAKGIHNAGGGIQGARRLR